MVSLPDVVRDGVRLARRRCMDRDKWMRVTDGQSAEIVERVGLLKPERVVRLRLDVDADHVEADGLVAHRGTAGAAEEIEQARTTRLGHCATEPRRLTFVLSGFPKAWRLR